VTTATGGRLAFTCIWCGQSVTLLVSDSGDELPDAHAFLAQHSACLHRGDPPTEEQQAIVLPR